MFIGHLASTGAAPTVAAGTDSASVSLTSGSTDTAGNVSSTATTLPAANANLVTVTFAATYGAAPKVIDLQSTSSSAAGGALYVQNVTTTSFQVYTRTAPGAGTVTTFSYFVVQ